jgi:hypothetical protein
MTLAAVFLSIFLSGDVRQRNAWCGGVPQENADSYAMRRRRAKYAQSRPCGGGYAHSRLRRRVCTKPPLWRRRVPLKKKAGVSCVFFIFCVIFLVGMGF